MIYNAALELSGDIMQIPPVYSAIKVGGKRAYKFARKDEELKLESRNVNIREFEITRIAMPDVDFRISCSKGTYIRSIARDFGEALQSGAHLTSLRRTRIGEFRVADAQKLDELTAAIALEYERDNPEVNIEKDNL